MQRAIVLHGADNVATMLDSAVTTGRCVLTGKKSGEIVITSDIPFGHKVAIVGIEKGENIRKYGEVIGRSLENIMVGSHVHVHNVESLRGRGDLANKE